ncbi:glycosyl transferase family 2 [Frondihabitans sp. PAMC 28766]|uniref:glycosyltransferase family 2 protein n=1 Tax=Frondihabitans sp. PAMC 28766 TaxID=1795630 RepID=UPI00078DA9E6|nr:glycosyltransferase family 2 protein [Frondihabitans sp. PAMC 28766]AMM20325.1 glycosyl transferase family 2 [Frondihabitans sp. PAMC 28766]
MSAEDRRPEADSPSGVSGVSYVMPVLNEVAEIRAAVESLVAQDYEGPFEVILALGPSVDGTNEVVAQMAADDARIRSIPNPEGSTPAGLNVAILASRYPVTVRVDAHSILPPEYTRIAVATLERSGADNVGGIMHAEGRSPFEKAVARAYGSRVGLGGTPHHVGGKEGPAETAYLGVFLRHRLVEVGLFDENIKRGQDWELNRRLRATGGVVWFTPALTVTYRPRPSLRTLVRQFVATGIWRGELVRRFAFANSLRYLVPPVMVLGVLLGFVAGILGLIGLGVGTGLAWATLGFIVPAIYVVFVVVATLASARAEDGKTRAWFLVVLPCIHFGWGIGFVAGFLTLTKNITAHVGR